MSSLIFAKRLMKTLFAALVALLLCLGVTAVPAFADTEDEAEDKNTINVRQLPDGSFLYDTSIVELATADAYYDGMTVVVTGEAMGEAITADVDFGYCWITVYSLHNAASTVHNPSSIEVYASKTQAEVIDSYGSYGVTGSTIQVRGTYHLACVEHQGISDIHADQISVTQMGHKTENPIDLVAFVPGAVLLLVGGALCLLYRRKNEGQK